MARKEELKVRAGERRCQQCHRRGQHRHKIVHPRQIHDRKCLRHAPAAEVKQAHRSFRFSMREDRAAGVNRGFPTRAFDTQMVFAD